MKLGYAWAVAVLSISPVLCGDARSIDFTTVLTAPDGSPITECRKTSDDGRRCEQTEPITLGTLSIAGLSAGDRNASAQDQIARGKLAYRISGAKAIELTADEVKLIKDQIAKLGFNPLAVWQACKLLDPAQCKD